MAHGGGEHPDLADIPEDDEDGGLQRQLDQLQQQNLLLQQQLLQQNAVAQQQQQLLGQQVQPVQVAQQPLNAQVQQNAVLQNQNAGLGNVHHPGVPMVVPPPAAPQLIGVGVNPIAANVAPIIGAAAPGVIVNPPPVMMAGPGVNVPAAAGAPGGDWGQARVFEAAPNPLVATTPGQVGDLGATNLQMLELMRELFIGNPARIAQIDQLATVVRPVVQASDATRNRERVTTELQPLSRVQAMVWGHQNQIANIRLHNVPNFSGASHDKIDIVSWIDRIMNLAQSNNLTQLAGINLMVMASTGVAADYIRQMRDEGKTFYQVVQALEMRYGDLCSPIDARNKCSNLARKPAEKLIDFIDRLRKMAMMACRNILDEETKRAQMEDLVKNNIYRVLPISVKKAIDERLFYHNKMGLPEMSGREFEKQCIELERMREERKEAGMKSTHNQPQVLPRRHVRQVQESAAQEDSESDTESLTSDLSEDEIDEEAAFWISRLEQVERKYAAKGRRLTPQQIRAKATQRYNRDRGRWADKKKTEKGTAAQVQGPPERLEPQERRRRGIGELLALANVTRGECIQCGTPGHLMGRDECALRSRPLVDRSCAKCGKGLHSADDCLRGFSTQFKGKADPVTNANVVQENEDLNI
jgi:hypothetical protein